MKKTELRKIIEKEYREMRKWDNSDPFRYSKLMYDTSDGDIWSDVFLDENGWKEYRSETIHSVPISELIYQNTGNRPMKISEIIDAIADYIMNRLDPSIIEN